MANNSIRYSEGTDAVLNLASKISSLGDDFFKEYTDLYTIVLNDLEACWRGDDYEAFKTVVQDEKHYFEAMRDCINEYATFLRNTANAHEARKDDSKTQATTNCTFG